jgi:hypothetical protein
MTAPVVEAALAAIAARLASAVPGAAVERARRSPVDLDAETLPRLVLQVDSLDADSTAEPGVTHYRLSFIVVGSANGANDLAAQQAVLIAARRRSSRRSPAGRRARPASATSPSWAPTSCSTTSTSPPPPRASSPPASRCSPSPPPAPPTSERRPR